jgi:hypothetical protein
MGDPLNGWGGCEFGWWEICKWAFSRLYSHEHLIKDKWTIAAKIASLPLIFGKEMFTGYINFACYF